MTKHSKIYFELKSLLRNHDLIDSHTIEELSEKFLFICDYPDLAGSLANLGFKGERVPLWEGSILTSSSLCVDYVRFNIKGPWEEAEEIIFTNNHSTLKYVKWINKTIPNYAIRRLIEDFMPSYFPEYLSTGNLKGRLSPELEVVMLKGEHHKWHKKAYLTFLQTLVINS